MAARKPFWMVALPAVLFLFPGVLFGGKEFQPPKASPAYTYPARDSHPKEKVTIAADPYDTPEKLKIFRLKYLQHNVVPILLIVTNESGNPVVLRNMEVQLTTSDRHAKLSPLDPDDLFRRFQNVRRASDVKINPLPIPKTPGQVKGGLKQEDRDEVERAVFQAGAVEGNSTQSGFLFFDVSGLQTPPPDAKLYITGITDTMGAELMYFEIPLDAVFAH